MPVVLIGTLDTKGTEIGFVADLLKSRGIAVHIIDAGALGEASIAADVSREKVFEAAGTSLSEVRDQGDRGQAVTLAAEGVRRIVRDLFEKGLVEGALGLGGSAGTTIATSAMRDLPLGVPKLMVSTLASGQVRPYVGPRDIMMVHAVTDISGINRISRAILSNATSAMAGMVRHPAQTSSADKPLWSATMFGVTTPCVEECRRLAEAAGCEVLVFHAVGTGGEAMESLIADDLIEGVLDLTTTELADELVGGILTAGPDRLTAAAKRGVPQVVSVGALDMVNFGPRETVPKTFADRQFYIHNATVTLMRTTVQENERLGKMIATKLSSSAGPFRVLLPMRGVSAIDAEGKPFWDPKADAALFDAIHKGLPSEMVIDVDAHINDPIFAETAVRELQSLVQQHAKAVNTR